MKTITAIILSAGSGSRAKTPIPKQYTSHQGKILLAHTIDSFLNHKDIDYVQVVIAPNDIKYYNKTLADISGDKSKLKSPVDGGKNRTQSSINGLSVVETDLVLIHDGARPFVSSKIISDTINALENHDAVVPTIPINSSVKTLNGKNIDRNELRLAQTPQGFKTQLIKQAYNNNNIFNDDASAIEHITNIHLINDCERNKKMTTPNDFVKSPRVGSGYDIHAFKDGNHVVLCGVKIPHNKAFTAHSDGDVAIHALCDALYGTIADGDIGRHFPPSDNKWRGADSSIFLKHAISRIKDLGGYVGNIDITIVCENPKITPHSEKMRKNIASIINIDISKISIKATTSEKLGFTGRNEGIASHATVMVFV